MLIWYQPKPNEVNFLPWLEHYLEKRRRSRLVLYVSAAVILLLGLGALGWLYVNLLQARAGMLQQVSEGRQQLQVLQRKIWAGSLEKRRIEHRSIIEAQKKFYSWLPVQELSRLLITLAPNQQLVSWQWQPIREGQQVMYKITGQDPWQHWWQDTLSLWPSMHLVALGPEGDGWKLKARYLLPIMPLPVVYATETPKLETFALQLRPQPLSAYTGEDKEFEPIAYITGQVTRYGKSLEIVHGQRDQGVQVNKVCR